MNFLKDDETWMCDELANKRIVKDPYGGWKKVCLIFAFSACLNLIKKILPLSYFSYSSLSFRYFLNISYITFS